MPPIPVSKLTELALSRRKLFEKIMQHVATRKIQNSMQATGDRMTITPQQFGMQLGKQSALILPSMGVGAGLGAVTAPSGHRMEGAGRGAAKGTGTGLGAMIGAPVGALGALALTAANPRLGKALFSPSKQQLANYLRQMFRRGDVLRRRPIRAGGPGAAIDKKLQLANTLIGGGTAGVFGGGAAGYAGTSAALGKPSWEKKEASMLSAVGRGAKNTATTLARGIYHTPRSIKTLAAGAGGGYYVGRQHGAQVGDEQAREDITKTLADLLKNKTPQKKASVLSVLGGLTGGGLGGLAGGAGGGILGALGGGALGGGPGAGLGLLAGGAAGLGAGAHMGGNIGANIGASFSKKKERPESEEKEEKSEEKSEDSGDEEVKKSAAAVLEQLQKNA